MKWSIDVTTGLCTAYDMLDYVLLPKKPLMLKVKGKKRKFDKIQKIIDYIDSKITNNSEEEYIKRCDEFIAGIDEPIKSVKDSDYREIRFFEEIKNPRNALLQLIRMTLIITNRVFKGIDFQRPPQGFFRLLQFYSSLGAVWGVLNDEEIALLKEKEQARTEGSSNGGKNSALTSNFDRHQWAEVASYLNSASWIKLPNQPKLYHKWREKHDLDEYCIKTLATHLKLAFANKETLQKKYPYDERNENKYI